MAGSKESCHSAASAEEEGNEELFWKRAPRRCHAERSWAQRSNSWKQTLGIWILLRGFGHREALSGNVLLRFEKCGKERDPDQQAH